MTPRNNLIALATLLALATLRPAGAQTPAPPPIATPHPEPVAVQPAPVPIPSAPVLLSPLPSRADDDLPATPALAPAGNPNERIALNWTALPLSMAIPEIEKLTGRTIIRPATLPNVADLSLAFATPPTRAEALQAIETLFAINQLSLIPLGEKLLKLVPLASTRIEAPTIIEGTTLGLPPSGRIASKLFQLEFLRAAEFIQPLQSMLNDQIRTISVFERSNAILITDSISTLQRIETIIKQVDRPASTPVQAKFYSLEYAKASDIVNKIKAIFVGPLQQQLGASTSFNSDDRTNQVVVIGDPRQLPFFDDLIKKLDVKADPNTRNEVIRLKSAQCTDVATLLSNIISGQTRAAQASAGALGGGGATSSQRQAAAAAGGASRQGRTTGGGGTGQQSGSRNSGSGSRATQQQAGGGQNTTRVTMGGATAQQSANPMRLGGGGSTTPAFAATGGITGASLGLDGNEFSTFITVQADQRTNSIVVSGTVDDIRIIKELVEKLDVLLAQVRIEVVIAEVSLTDEAQSGIDALGLQVTAGKLTGIASSGPGYNFGSSGTTSSFVSSLQPLTGIISLSTTPRKNNTNIVSVPSITTMHNKQGKIFIGETRPVITASTVNTSGVGNPTTSSVTQLEIGTTITVTPLIGYDGSVQLDVQQEISDVSGIVKLDGNDQYVIGKRNTISTIIVKSGEIIVLGGIQKTSASKTTSRLGPIPIIGDLFGARKRSQSRTELIFFLRPTVLTNTATDNAPAMHQLDGMSNKEAVQKVLGQTPTPPAPDADALPPLPSTPKRKPSKS